jgi:hypothetical protein
MKISTIMTIYLDNGEAIRRNITAEERKKIIEQTACESNPIICLSGLIIFKAKISAVIMCDIPEDSEEACLN